MALELRTSPKPKRRLRLRSERSLMTRERYNDCPFHREHPTCIAYVWSYPSAGAHSAPSSFWPQVWYEQGRSQIDGRAPLRGERWSSWCGSKRAQFTESLI